MEEHPKALILAGDSALAAELRAALVESFDADVFVSPSVAATRKGYELEDFDVFVADASLDDEDFIACVGDATTHGVPTILIDDSPLVAERVLGALRLGVIDVMARPVDFNHFSQVVEVTLDARRQSRHDFRRQNRLRELSSRMVRDRRELRQRIDLLCKDLVTAYRRLAEKVVAYEEKE